MKSCFLLENVSFKFDQELSYFFYKMNVAFEEGKINFIQGRNGIGKSTLFRIMQGEIEYPEYIEGSVAINSEKYFFKKDASLLSNSIGLVEQNVTTMIADQLSFEHNLRMASMGYFPSLKFLKKVKSLPDFVAQFGIDYHKQVHLLSGGQKQILAILMMLQKTKKVLLLDEPTAALDDKNAQQVFSFLSEIATKTSTIVVVISHDTEIVKQYAHKNYYEMVRQDTGERLLRTVAVF
jgi:energy-coupling factor transporter ATP-binding protein EcfA2